MSVSIILGCADAAIAEQLRTNLAENVELELVDIVEDGRGLISAIDRSQADVLVLHEGLGPVPALEQVRDTAMSRPHVGIVLLTADPTPETYARSMEVGARGVLAVPFTLEELSDRLDAAAGWSRLVRSHLAGDALVTAGQRGRLVTVTGAGGGVGTSLIATLIAMHSQRNGLRTALVDLDLQNGDIAHLLGIRPRRTILDLAGVAGEITPRSLSDTAFRDDTGLLVYVAPEHGELAEDMSARSARLIVANLRQQVDVVIVDCGNHVDDVTAVAVEYSDTVVLVATPEVPSLRSGRRRMELWERLQIAKSEDVQVILNRTDRRTEIQPDVASEILGRPLVDPPVPNEVREAEYLVNGARVGIDRPGRLTRAVGAVTASLGLVAGSAGSAPMDPVVTGKRPRRGRAQRSQSGQVMVETPVVVALLLLFSLMLFQMLAWGWTHVVAEGVANEVARTAAVGGDTCRVARSSVTSGWGLAGCPRVQRGGGDVSVTVTTPTIVPGLGSLPVRVTTSYVREG